MVNLLYLENLNQALHKKLQMGGGSGGWLFILHTHTHPMHPCTPARNPENFPWGFCSWQAGERRLCKRPTKNKAGVFQPALHITHLLSHQRASQEQSWWEVSLPSQHTRGTCQLYISSTKWSWRQWLPPQSFLLPPHRLKANYFHAARLRQEALAGRTGWPGIKRLLSAWRRVRAPPSRGKKQALRLPGPSTVRPGLCTRTKVSESQERGGRR